MPHIEITPAPVSSAVPSGSAGGDLAGTYPNPTLKATGPGATGPVGDAATVPVITIDAQGRVTGLTSTASGSYGLSQFGDGSDGSPTFDGTTTILGVAPSPSGASGVYTLNRDWFLASPTINSGITIVTNGFRFLANGTLTNNGTIKWNGNDASGATGGAGLQSDTSASMTGLNVVGFAGGSGGTGVGPGGTGGTGFGGSGGHGGTATGNNGGNGGASTSPNANQQVMRSLPAANAGVTISTVGAIANRAGSGGGAGGGDGTNSGGGGGSGGGIVVVIAKTIAGTGAMRARGGAGGTPPSGNCGGGGGGGGGFITVISGSVSAGAIAGQTIDANAGTHGNASGTGTNAAVTNGSSGTVILLPA